MARPFPGTPLPPTLFLIILQRFHFATTAIFRDPRVVAEIFRYKNVHCNDFALQISSSLQSLQEEGICKFLRGAVRA